MTAKERLSALIRTSAQEGSLKRLTFSRPRKEGDAGRISGRLCLFRDAPVLALESLFSDGKVKHSRLSLPLDEGALMPLIRAYAQVNLSTSQGDAEYRCSQKGKEFLAAPKGMSTAPATVGLTLPTEGLDRKKKRFLNGDEPFLRELEIADASGRIHDKKQPKFRQINRFLEHLSEIEEALPKTDPLVIYDLCCGKSYLSFAVYHYFTVLCHRRVDMLCLDLKQDVMDFCAEAARRLSFDGMRFLAEDVRRTPTGRPGLVISLHACDIATDLVLSQGIRLQADVILSTPCCHHTLSDHLRFPALQFVTEQPQLRRKLSEALTDGLRCLRLSAAGYRVTALELTDPDDTPKNTLIRAVRNKRFSADSAAAAKASAAYREALHTLFGEGAQAYLDAIE